MIKTYVSNNPEEVDKLVNEHNPKPWATQTDMIVFNNVIYHKAVVFYGDR